MLVAAGRNIDRLDSEAAFATRAAPPRVLCGLTATVGSFWERLPVLHAVVVASLAPS